MNDARVQELLSGMTSFEKGHYPKSEMLEEMFKLQKEMVNLTFNGEHSSEANLKIYDVEKHFEQLNEQNGYIANEELEKFKYSCKKLSNFIKAEISGRRGESIAFKEFENLASKNIVIKNLELENGATRTEIDAVVITNNGITIVEVKNSQKNIYIDEKGDFYKISEYSSLDCNIAYKMSLREKLLRDALEKSGIKNVEIQKIVVFTNKHIEIHNICSSIKHCFVSQLAYTIDSYKGEMNLTDDQMLNMKAAIEKAECKRKYPADFNVGQFKLDFAILMSVLEDAAVNINEDITEKDCTEKTEELNESDNEKVKLRKITKYVVDSKQIKCVCGFVAGFAMAAIYSTLSINKKRGGKF